MRFNPFEKPASGKRISITERRKQEQRKEDLKKAGMIVAGALAVGAAGVEGEMIQSNQQNNSWEEKNEQSMRAEEMSIAAHKEDGLNIAGSHDTATPPEVTISRREAN